MVTSIWGMFALWNERAILWSSERVPWALSGPCTQASALEMLGLERPSSLELCQLQQAFRRQAREMHPDRGGNAEAPVRPVRVRLSQIQLKLGLEDCWT